MHLHQKILYWLYDHVAEPIIGEDAYLIPDALPPRFSRYRQHLPPSFAYQIASLKRYKATAAEKLMLADPPFPMRDKLELPKWLRANGYNTPEHYMYIKLEELSRCITYDKFVIKPRIGSYSQGVQLLVREKDDIYKDIHSGDIKTLTEWEASLREEMIKEELEDEWIIEELLSPENPPDDYKFYCFQGRVALILQVCRKNDMPVYKSWSRYWKPLYTGKYILLTDNALPKPDMPEECMRVAKELSLRIPLAFLRVDLYCTKGRVYVGELTPFPGKSHKFNHRFDEHLDYMFENADKRLKRRQEEAQAGFLKEAEKCA